MRECITSVGSGYCHLGEYRMTPMSRDLPACYEMTPFRKVLSQMSRTLSPLRASAWCFRSNHKSRGSYDSYAMSSVSSPCNEYVGMIQYTVLRLQIGLLAKSRQHERLNGTALIGRVAGEDHSKVVINNVRIHYHVGVKSHEQGRSRILEEIKT